MIRFAYGRLFQDGLDQEHGLPRARLDELTRRFPVVQDEVRARRAAGEYGFYDLTDQGATVREIAAFAEGLGQAHDHVLVLGIGFGVCVLAYVSMMRIGRLPTEKRILS